jgi:hypothetical protein
MSDRDQAVAAVNTARQARDDAFDLDPLSTDTVQAYVELGTAYHELARWTDDEVAKTAMYEAAIALALLAYNLRMSGGAP